MKHYRALTIASLKMYFRNKQAIFWALFFPFVFMLIVGQVNLDSFSAPEVAVVDEADNANSRALLLRLQGEEGDGVLDIQTMERREASMRLEAGDLDAMFVIPQKFGAEGARSTVEVRFDARADRERAVAVAILDDSLEGLFRDVAEVPPEFQIESRFGISQSAVQAREQNFRSFLVPGIAAMAIMQSGIFSVVFSLIRFRAQGVLRRLYATPIDPTHFLVGQVITRLIVAVLQTFILLIVGSLALGVTVGGSAEAWTLLTLFAVLGGALFISIGLAISGRAKTENTAAPISNIITLPMIFLSGVFIPLDILPEAIRAVSQFLPLTYLADGMRAVATQHAGFTDVVPELLGLLAWMVAAFAVSAKLFRWE